MLVGALNQEKALVGAFSVIVKSSQTFGQPSFNAILNTAPMQLAHVTVLTGYRMLPRKDLVRAKQYFIIDAACAAVAYSLHQVKLT